MYYNSWCEIRITIPVGCRLPKASRGRPRCLLRMMTTTPCSTKIVPKAARLRLRPGVAKDRLLSVVDPSDESRSQEPTSELDGPQSPRSRVVRERADRAGVGARGQRVRRRPRIDETAAEIHEASAEGAAVRRCLRLTRRAGGAS